MNLKLRWTTQNAQSSGTLHFLEALRALEAGLLRQLLVWAFNVPPAQLLLHADGLLLSITGTAYAILEVIHSLTVCRATQCDGRSCGHG